MQASWLHTFNQQSNASDSTWQAVKLVMPSLTWVLPLIGPLALLLFLLLFRPCLFNSLVKNSSLPTEKTKAADDGRAATQALAEPPADPKAYLSLAAREVYSSKRQEATDPSQEKRLQRNDLSHSSPKNEKWTI